MASNIFVVREDIERVMEEIPLNKLLRYLELESVEVFGTGDRRIDPGILEKYVSLNEYYLVEGCTGDFCRRILFKGRVVLNAECFSKSSGNPVACGDRSVLTSLGDVEELSIYRVLSPFTAWMEEYEVGFKPMDDAHRVMFEKLNGVIEYIVEGKPDKITEAFKEAYDYILLHFKIEEEYMARCGYDKKKMKEHVKRHREFKEVLDKLTATGRASEFVAMFGELYEYIASYLDYMLRDDKDLAEFLKNTCGM